MGEDGTSAVTSRVRRFERALHESDAVLWTVVLLASVFDVVTTMVGLERGFAEGNAVARAFIHTYGTPGIGLLKFSALVVVVLSWALLPERYGTTVLQGMAVVSLVVVALNAATLAGV
jgi:uncharacterized membrane protein